MPACIRAKASWLKRVGDYGQLCLCDPSHRPKKRCQPEIPPAGQSIKPEADRLFLHLFPASISLRDRGGGLPFHGGANQGLVAGLPADRSPHAQTSPTRGLSKDRPNRQAFGEVGG